ncbi:pitrilysin family protein [Homoserinimonas sp. OAct 916]|uniref:M16 family metallopeptidase n=1 Tax=Homoserinimonas sp. OAct 916 TaxID=2211450 RepID=UPI000DBE8C31|nr:pitrilysin family protein [Homoserinimonas sp. OAct 916]
MTGSVDLPLDLAELSFTAAGESLIRRTVLPSGVRILSEFMPGSRSATLGYWVAVGSRDESAAAPSSNGTAGQSSNFGSTHFLEHLLFKGTGTRSAFDIASAFDRVGGEHNAMTAKEYTCYYAKVRDGDLAMAVEVIADMLCSSVLDRDEFEIERGVILEELAMADDDPADVASERFFQTVLGEHPLGRPIGGNADTIRAVQRDAVWEHYRANYRPQDLVITAAGAVDHDELVAGVEASLRRAGWDLGLQARPVERRATTAASIAGGGRLSVVHRPIEQSNILIGVPGLLATDDRRVTLSVLNSIFGGGMSSRLFQEIREKRGLAYSVYSFGAGYSDAGVFGIYAGCSPAKAAQVTELMLAELHKLARFGVTDDEMERATGQLSGASALALENSDTRMSRLGRSEITMGEFSDLDESLRLLAQVTADDVQQLAADLAGRTVSVAAVGTVDEDSFAPILDIASHAPQ